MEIRGSGVRSRSISEAKAASKLQADELREASRQERATTGGGQPFEVGSSSPSSISRPRSRIYCRPLRTGVSALRVASRAPSQSPSLARRVKRPPRREANPARQIALRGDTLEAARKFAANRNDRRAGDMRIGAGGDDFTHDHPLPSLIFTWSVPPVSFVFLANNFVLSMVRTPSPRSHSLSSRVLIG